MSLCSWIKKKTKQKPVVISQPAEPIDVVNLDEPIFLAATKYYLALERDYSMGDKNGVFLDRNGNVLYRCSEVFKKAARIEGSAKLNDGRVLNYLSNDRWYVVDAPYGMGVGNVQLKPYFSCAVDRNVVPLGTTLYIKETAGLMIDGETHDGYWQAHDIGGAIKGNRIDLFCGAGIASMAALNSISHLQKLTVYQSAKEITLPPSDNSLSAQQSIYAFVRREYEKGVSEIPGSRDNPDIQKYHDSVPDLTWAGDDTAWCSSFMNWCVEAALGEGKGTNSGMARSWMDWGQKVDNPKEGDIVVFWRGSKDGWQGHVSTFLKFNGDYVQCMGGNQGNAITIANYPRSRVLGYRRAA